MGRHEGAQGFLRGLRQGTVDAKLVDAKSRDIENSFECRMPIGMHII